MANIDNYENDAIVVGTDADDEIYSSGENVTINAGAGNDSISLASYNYDNIIITIKNINTILLFFFIFSTPLKNYITYFFYSLRIS